ncbi:MAG: hypothetical protein A2826_00310 [Candidatus Doudnabacteria bacterium RIFCSPHIGHO2_01_FULL_43_23]|uniref:DUF559 domain-containing protein n=1 Tax=Candidatus Doudnabacteria bacterium RIFCSPHIGHO2_01_FULL_43_23 TaxID=1817822 RepID=A0A1F5NTE8_9BACT|nr:MAG: hypothetical protein A2826_00310 [Candidatus Doudnabacteria bacterium RIFCSPHIGHO2_01_FULL_43_23]
MTMQIRNRKILKTIRSRLRRAMPAPEVIIWEKLRNRQTGVKFRRQFSVYNYVLDFYAPTIKLALEIDGDSHYRDSNARSNDKKKDRALSEIGIKVLRFTNYEIMTNLDGVCNVILGEVDELKSTPS